MSDRFSAVAARAQTLDGFAQTLGPVSLADRFKVQQSIADGIVYITQDGGPWLPIATGAGASATLASAYANGPAGNTILMTDALGAVNFSSEITSGSIVGIATTNAPATLTAAVTGLKIDMRSVGTAATPSTFDVPAILVEGAYSSVAKAAGSALVAIRSGYRNATALSVRVRNKQAAAGSIAVFGWDTTNYEGAVAPSIITGDTHVVTIDASTNVTPGDKSMTGLRVVMPAGTGTIRGIDITSTQTASNLLEINANGSSATVSGAYITMASGVTNASRGVVVDWLSDGGALVGCIMVGSSAGITLSGRHIGAYLNMQTSVTAGSQAVYGGYALMPASSSVSTTGFYVDTRSTAGRFFAGEFSVITAPSGTFVGCEIDCQTLLTGNGEAVIGARYRITNSSNTSTAGVIVDGTFTGSGSAGVRVTLTPSSGNASGVTVSMGANISKTGITDGSAFLATLTGANTCGLCVAATYNAGALAQNGVQMRREMTSSASFTESTTFLETVNTSTFTGGTQTFSQSLALFGNYATISGATHTWSGNLLLLTNAMTRSSGTGTLSGTHLKVSHVPTGTFTDTTTGIAVNMTPATSSAVSGVVVTMAANASATSVPLAVNYQSLAGSTDGVLRVSANVSGTTSAALTLAKLDVKTATLTLGAALTGLVCNLSTRVAAGAQTVTGGNVTMPSGTGIIRGLSVTTTGNSSDSASSAGIYISSGFARNGACALRVDCAPTSGQTTFGPKALLIQTTNNNWVDGNFCEITNSSTGVNAAWNLLALTVNPAGMTANAQMRCLATSYAPTFTSGTFSIGTLCCYLNCAPTWNSAGTGSSSGTVVGIGNAPVRSAGTLNLADTLLSVSHAPSGTIGTDTTKLISGTTISKSGTVLDFSTTGTLTGTLNYLSIDASGATAGAQIIAGAYIKLPASSSASTSGVWVSTVSTAGRFFNGDFTASTTLSGTFVGCEIDCSTNVAAGTTQAILGARFRISNSSSVSTVGVQVDTTQTASTSAAVKLNLTPASGAPSGVIVSMGASVAKTGLTDGSAFLATLVGAASCGLCINASVSTSAFGQNAIQARREMTTSTGMTDSTTFVELINTSTYNGGTTTISQSNVLSAMLATIAGATWTWSGNLLYVQSAPTRSSGTVTLSGKLANLTHAPTGTISADTTTGLYVSMTTTGAAVGAQITMSAGTTGPALSITHSGTGSNQNQLVFTAAVDGTGAHIYGPTTAQFNIFAGTAAQASGTTAGRDLVLQASSAVAGSSSAGAAAGGSVYIRAKDAARLTSGNANGGDVSINPGAGIGTGVAGGFLVGSTNATFMELYSMTAPAVGAASTGRLFVVDNGAGKMQLAVQFPSGAAQVLATEP